MEHKLHEEPPFSFEALLATASGWKARSAKDVIVEWSTGTGPVIFYYPAGERVYGKKWTVDVTPDGYSEIYADFIEFKLLPKIVEALKQTGFAVAPRCVDLQPLQVQRSRRRAIKREEAVAGHH